MRAIKLPIAWQKETRKEVSIVSEMCIVMYNRGISCCMAALYRSLLLIPLLVGCDNDPISKLEKPKEDTKTKLIYFGFDNRAETPEDVLRLAKMWGDNPPCAHWRATIKKEYANYQVIFGTADVTLIDRKGQVLYSGGQGVLSLPHGNPDGTGVNICKFTGE
jgi:hypothetical protein